MTQKLKVYLAGSIVGCTMHEACQWRSDLSMNLEQQFDFIDPTKELPYLEHSGVYGQTETPSAINGSRAMYQRELFHIGKADIIVLKLDPVRQQIGSMFELGYAVAKDKPIIFLADDHTPVHPFILNSGLVTYNFEELMIALVPYAFY